MRNVSGVYSELKRRRVFRVGIGYVIAAWIVIQVADATFEPLHIAAWVQTVVVIVAIAGLPVSLVLAWLYQLTPAGVRRDTFEASPSTAAPAEPDATGPTTASIAVLPFTDLSAERDQGYLCDGIAEEILNQLTRIPGLNVASRTSSFQFRDRDGADPARVAATLNVQTFLEGSVRRSGERLRVTTQLINAADGYHLWSERFDTDLRDVLDVQDRIAESVTRALRLSLDPETHRFSRSGRTADAEAYELYLKGWHHYHRFSSDNLRQARKLFKRAAELDPGFSRALSALAVTDATLYLYAQSLPEYREEAERASLAAVGCCPDMPETQAARGMVHLINKEYAAAEACFERALELDPRHFDSLVWYARTCVHQGKFRDAARLFERAADARPTDFRVPLLLPQIYLELREPDQARAWSRRGLVAAETHLAAYPDDVSAMYMLAGAYADRGERERGRTLIERALDLEPNEGSVLYNAACFYARVGELDRALDLLERANLPAMSNRGWMEHDPDFNPLRDHPRFRALLDSLPP